MGEQLEGLKDILDDERQTLQVRKTWAQLGAIEKSMKIVSWALLVIAAMIFVGLIIWFRKKMKAYDELLEKQKDGEILESVDENWGTPMQYARASLQPLTDPLDRKFEVIRLDHM
jgi:flagellar biosynthesis/type III secretory pathway M-ring protein FliF/YscJ